MLSWFTHGLSNKKISLVLSISPRTVPEHGCRIDKVEPLSGPVGARAGGVSDGCISAGPVGHHYLFITRRVVTVKHVFAMSMVSLAVAVGVVALSSSAAQAFHRADLIESLQETVVQPDSMRVKGWMRVDVIESIGSEGPVQSYTSPMSH